MSSGAAPRGSPRRRRGGAYAELEVLATGPQALVQDLGRPGLASVGVGRSGAADRGSFSLAARLLGQDPGHAAIEVLLGGLALRSTSSVTVVLTGAPAPATVDGAQVGHAAPFLLPRGSTLQLARPVSGLRTYVAVRGGIDVPAVLGSRATDTLSGLGPTPLQAGDLLPVGTPSGSPTVDVAPVAAPPAGPITLRAVVGPRHDWLDDVGALASAWWRVSSRSDRVGVRLEGPALQRHADRDGQELTSEGVVRGSIQVPPGGQPVLFLADHPVTGGYPVVAVVRDPDVDLAAQAVPGQTIRIVLEHP